MTAFERIRDVWMPMWMEHFEKKSADYNTKASNKRPAFQPHEMLGIRGQWADIWRKVWKLHKALWDGEELTGEQPREIILDMIGHLFLTLDLMDKEERQSKQTKVATLGVRSDRDRLFKLVGHGFDNCGVCVRKVGEIELAKGGKFDWEEDTP